MRDRFTITITDIEGSKHFMLHQIVKKFILYVALFILLVIAGGACFIAMLNNEIDILEDKKKVLLDNELELNLKSLKLQSLIDDKAEEFNMLQDKVSSIEELIGLDSDENSTIHRRLDKIKVSSSAQGKLLKFIPNGAVLGANTITAKFGWRQHPIKNKREFHPGVDLKAKMNTPIKSPASGVVRYSSSDKRGYGKMIIIEHSLGFQTRYAHLNKFNVQNGQFVSKGEVIGYTGNTGLSTGPHLHYEVRFIGRILDPINFLHWTKNNFTSIFEKETRVLWQSLVNTIMTGNPNQVASKPISKTQKQQ